MTTCIFCRVQAVSSFLQKQTAPEVIENSNLPTRCCVGSSSPPPSPHAAVDYSGIDPVCSKQAEGAAAAAVSAQQTNGTPGSEKLVNVNF